MLNYIDQNLHGMDKGTTWYLMKFPSLDAILYIKAISPKFIKDCEKNNDFIFLFTIPRTIMSPNQIDFSSLPWRHNGRGGVSNHQPHDC